MRAIFAIEGGGAAGGGIYINGALTITRSTISGKPR